MKTELERFNDTVSILVKAYFNGTLKHKDCSMCAVGNICAAAGFPQTYEKGHKSIGIHDAPHAAHWGLVFMTDADDLDIGQTIYPDRYYGNAKIVIDATGYTWQELARIEFAFESAPSELKTEDDETWMFNGLMAVVSVLGEIHGIDLETTESAKLQFVK
jgi:hypothetical protein